MQNHSIPSLLCSAYLLSAHDCLVYLLVPLLRGQENHLMGHNQRIVWQDKRNVGQQGNEILNLGHPPCAGTVESCAVFETQSPLDNYLQLMVHCTKPLNLLAQLGSHPAWGSTCLNSSCSTYSYIFEGRIKGAIVVTVSVPGSIPCSAECTCISLRPAGFRQHLKTWSGEVTIQTNLI